MDYVKELTLFYDWMELHPLSPSAINLWNALVHVHYKTGWQESFAVNEMVLCLKTNLSGRTLRKARAELKEKGRIDFVSQKGKAPTYRMIPFQAAISSTEEPSLQEERVFSSQTTENLAEVSASEYTAVTAKPSSFYNKQQQKQEKKMHADWMDFLTTWRAVFSFDVKANHTQMIHSFMKDAGMSLELILEGIERVTLAQKPSLNYLWKILANWANGGIHSIKSLVQHEKKRAGSQSYFPKKEIRGRDLSSGGLKDLAAREAWA